MLCRMGLERLWAGWRSEYVASATGESGEDGCVFCRILAAEDDEEAYVLWRGDRCAAVLNAFPYTSGHLMVLPVRHVADLEDLEAGETSELWSAVSDAVRALKAAYQPQGLNLGANVGTAAGAGIPGHFHVHCLPRWNGDTNFMTTVAEVRVQPESLPASYEKLRDAWPTR
jgi:diadenosine tetraphosphate (Ap4A) HIT family hydrolase